MEILLIETFIIMVGAFGVQQYCKKKEDFLNELEDLDNGIQ